MNFQKDLLAVKVFAKISIRRVFRDKVALFFTFMFPLIFLFVFGGIFGKSSTVSFKIAYINQSKSDFAKQFTDQVKQAKLYKIDEKATTLDQAKEKMNRGQIDATILLPENFGVLDNGMPTGEAKVYYTQNSEQAGRSLTSVMDAQFQQMNAEITHAPTLFKVSGEQLASKGLKQFDYVFAGLLGFSIIGLGIFGPVNVFPELKKQGVLRRLHTTPLKTWQYFLANVISQSVVGLLTMVVMFAVAIAVFDLKLNGNIIELAVFLVLSIDMMLGIGLALGGWAKNERQAAPLTNIVVFPMMFLSGTFFPRFLMPDWLQKASNFLPLTPVIDGVRLIATESKHLWQVLPQVGLIGLWLIVIYLIAFRVFRWE